jgi:hypothetical protein
MEEYDKGQNLYLLTYLLHGAESFLRSEPVGSGSSPAADEQPEESPSPTWDFRVLIAAVAMQV